MNIGCQVKIATYGKVEKKLPFGIRHIYFLFKIIPNIFWADAVISLDTLSVGLPSIWAAWLFGKKIIVRVGGDFLWESYVERTKKLVTLEEFYNTKQPLNIKENIIYKSIKSVFNRSSAVVFTTPWLEEIFSPRYKISKTKTFVIENFYGPKMSSSAAKDKIFIAASRNIVLKNIEVLKNAFTIAKKSDASISLYMEHISRGELLEKIKSCYAVIVPSLSEVSPNLILEAIQYNKPFIITKENGLMERIGRFAITADPKDVQNIANQIICLCDMNYYENIKNLIENFKFEHSYEEIAREFLEVYKKI